MNDINKLFEEMEKAREEQLIEDLGLSEKELVDQKDNVRLRELAYLLLEGVAIAAKMSRDKVLEELVVQNCQPFWDAIPKETRAKWKKKHYSENLPRSVIETWCNNVSKEVGPQIWELLYPNNELKEIQNDIDDTISNLENRIETLEITVLKLAQQITNPQAPPEETK